MTLPSAAVGSIGARFVHGFTTRAGGVSAPPYDTLNLGGKWGDEPAHVTENRRRLAEAVGGAPVVARQVHGTVIRRVRAGDDPAAVARHEADGLCTDVPGPGAWACSSPTACRCCWPIRAPAPARPFTPGGAGRSRGSCPKPSGRWRRSSARARRTCASRWARRSAPAASRSGLEVAEAVVSADPRGARPGHRAAVAARPRRQGPCRSARREPPLAGTRGRRSGRRRSGRRVHAPRSGAVLFVPARRRRDGAADGRHCPGRGAGP